MTSGYIVISLLKHSSIPDKQLKTFLSYLQQKALKEYLLNASIYEGKDNLSIIELIDMIIAGKNKVNASSEDNELLMEEANDLLNNYSS